MNEMTAEECPRHPSNTHSQIHTHPSPPPEMLKHAATWVKYSLIHLEDKKSCASGCRYTVEVSHVQAMAAWGQVCVRFILKLKLNANQWLMLMFLPTSKAVISNSFCLIQCEVKPSGFCFYNHRCFMAASLAFVCFLKLYLFKEVAPAWRAWRALTQLHLASLSFNKHLRYTAILCWLFGALMLDLSLKLHWKSSWPGLWTSLNCATRTGQGRGQGSTFLTHMLKSQLCSRQIYLLIELGMHRFFQILSQYWYHCLK